MLLFTAAVLGVAGAVLPSPAPLAPDALRQQQWARTSARVAVVQLPAPPPCLPEAKSCTHAVNAADMAQLISSIQHAAADGVDLLLAPEYHMVNIHLDTARAGPRNATVRYTNPAVAAVSDAVRQANMYVAVGSWVLWTAGDQRQPHQYTNSILLFGRNGTIVGMYNKTHAAVGQGPYCWPPLANDTELLMVPGAAYPVFDLDFARIGVQTCYDGYFPEPMRAMALQGAEIILWPNSRGGPIEQDIVSASAFFNMVHIAAVNSANGAGSIVYAYPRGGNETPCAQSSDPPCYKAVDLDLHAVRVARKHSRMFHQRRPELAQLIAKDWGTSEFYNSYPDTT